MIDLDDDAQRAEFDKSTKPHVPVAVTLPANLHTWTEANYNQKGWTCVKCFQFFKEWTRFQYHRCASNPDQLPGTHLGVRDTE